MSSNPPLFLLPTDEKFNGANWLPFKTTLVEAAHGCGLLGYLKGTIPEPGTTRTAVVPTVTISTATDPDTESPSPAVLLSPSPPLALTTPTGWWGSQHPTLKEWHQRDAYACSMITLNVVNPVGAGVCMTGSSADAWKSLTTLQDAKSNVRLIAAEAELSSMEYKDGRDLDAHFAAMHTAWSNANNQGAGITDSKFRSYLIKSMPKAWAPVTGGLLTATSSVEVINRLTTHFLLVPGMPYVASARSAHVLATQSGGRAFCFQERCSNCERTGHTKDKCFRKGGGMEGQFSDWWRKGQGGGQNNGTNTPNDAPPQANATQAQAASVVPANNLGNPRCLAFLSMISNERGAHQLITYADLAASRHFFEQGRLQDIWRPTSPRPTRVNSS